MKLIALISIFLVQLSIAQNKISLSNWSSAMTENKRAAFAENIIFTYRYETVAIKDSVLSNLYNTQEQSQSNIVNWTHYVHAHFEKAKSNFDVALSHLDSCLFQAESEYLKALATTEKAKVLTILNDLAGALSTFDTALKICKKEKFIILQSSIYATMGEFYRKTAQFDLALVYLDSAQALVNLNDIYDEVNIDIFDRKAAIFSQTGEMDSMLYYSNKALAMAIDQQNLHAQAVSHNELGYYFEHKPNFDSAYYHYDMAIEIWKQTKANRYLSSVQSNKSRLLIKDEKWKEARDLLFETEEMCKNKEWTELYPSLYDELSFIYYKLGDSTNYYKYLNKKTQAHYTLYQLEHEKNIVQLQFQYKEKKHLAKIQGQEEELKQLKMALLQEEKESTKFKTIAFATGSLVMLMVFLLFLKRRKSKKASDL